MTKSLKERVVYQLREQAGEEINNALNEVKHENEPTLEEEGAILVATVSAKYLTLAADLLEKSKVVYP